MIAYLSGAMENAVNDGAAWREELTVWLSFELNHNVLDPVVLSASLAKKNGIKDYRILRENKPKIFLSLIQKMIDQDLEAVENCDYIICLWNEEVLKGAGTHGEVTYAYKINKPVYLLNMLPESQLSSWILGCSSKIFQNIDQLKQYLKKKYK